ALASARTRRPRGSTSNRSSLRAPIVRASFAAPHGGGRHARLGQLGNGPRRAPGTARSPRCAVGAKAGNVEMPITEQMYEVLYEDKSPRQAVVDLMARGLRREADRLFEEARCRIRLCPASTRAAKSRVMA